jgi:hypothetical protein
LRHAARRAELGLDVIPYWAIRRSQSRSDNSAVAYYKDYFSDDYFGEGWLYAHPLSSDYLVVALCFAAAIAESEGQ